MNTILSEIVKQLQFCEYQDKHGHQLENNKAFQDLKTIAEGYLVISLKNVAPNDYTTKFIGILSEMLGLARGPKTNDYGETWNKLGLMGLYVKIMIKEGRLFELIWRAKEAKVKDESLRDTLIDLANYAVYSIIALDEGNITGAAKKKEFYLQLVEETLKKIQTLEDDEDEQI